VKPVKRAKRAGQAERAERAEPRHRASERCVESIEELGEMWDETRSWGDGNGNYRGKQRLIRCDKQDYKPAQLGGPSNLHKDILENRDCSIQWEDIYTGTLRFHHFTYRLRRPDYHLPIATFPPLPTIRPAAMRQKQRLMMQTGTDNVFDLPEFHSELETKCRMNW
jgi:hypothetical protein